MSMKIFFKALQKNKSSVIAVFTLFMIVAYLFTRFILRAGIHAYNFPILCVLFLGGIPLLYEILKKIFRRDFGADLLAGTAIITSVFLGEYLAGAIVVLMLSGGNALESYAVQNASSVLKALAKRMPSIAHRRRNSEVVEIGVDEIVIGDTLLIFPHEICPVDGVIVEGHGAMNEAYLTGEPFEIDKAPGASVISGAINGNTALTIIATKLSIDSRYAKIMEVMRASEQNKPRLRRLGDQLGVIYTPVALLAAALAWIFSGDSTRFLAVLVVATPCPLLIGIPVAIIGSISLAARRGIVIKNPAILEQIGKCQTAIFDKTGTLTYGEPELSETVCASNFQKNEVLCFAASLERYSKHPLARAITSAARKDNISILEASEVHEIPGEGLKGTVSGYAIQIMGRNLIAEKKFTGLDQLLPTGAGLECVVLINGAYAATLRFHDAPRAESMPFIKHLGPKHQLHRSIIVSGDRQSEARYLAEKVGIDEVYAEKSPEEKLVIVREETNKAKTLYVGDGINDAPALMAATVGVAIGRNSDITSQAAGAVIMDSSLTKVDELIHIGRRMRAIALQSAIGGMALSFVGMVLAAHGYLTPVLGAISQEAIDLLAVLNALRVAFPPKDLSDFYTD
jgi:heavy metal translocating P-type ATPase